MPGTDIATDGLSLSKIGLGCGVFSGAYGPAPQGDIEKAIRAALSSGINLVDTSPYYNDSEIKLGQALLKLGKEFPRSSYYICTKVGRYGYRRADFDYSAKRVAQSVRESMRRLNTGYLDIVLCHDVEFVDIAMVVDVALPRLFELKRRGLVRKVGISGYPLDVLLRICQMQLERGAPLDVCLSYCSFNLHCQELARYAQKLRAAGVETIIAASPLSMGLLRHDETPEWHPAKPELKAAVGKCVELFQSRSERNNAKSNAGATSLAELAETFAFSYNDVDVHLTGAKTEREVEHALLAYDRAQRLQLYKNGMYEDADAQRVYAQVKSILKPFSKYTWPSPPVDA
ncbi:hypothetical protein H4R26_000721 [Coemansia thaxteri]|uniref:NADP-dependent oxidoreductase domain-containing protein n=1 Tax=Coemansia thaxteri TaxID=2663907 RepID=A0A9W8BHT0_9FUNG|nr:hypothetical protein H4R26_000721 [Coemansia thaxteri]KAJ2483332.1 hypothetical protein EV174_002973 [Coemansia sp. RSA 2320]